MDYLLQHPEGIAAFLSAVATAFAAFATLRGPATAAMLAEQLRRASQVEDERRRQRLFIFATLMQERADVSSLDGMRALNLIDVMFSDCNNVREAWVELYNAFLPDASIPLHVRSDRLRTLLKAMASELGLSHDLRSDDFSRIYIPNSIAQDNMVRRLQREASLRALQSQPEGSNTAAEIESGPFPPKP